VRFHHRVALFTLIVTLTSLGAATILWNASLQRERHQELDERLLDQARVLAAAIPAPVPDALPRLRDLTRRFHGETGMRLTVIAADGTVLAESNLSDPRVQAMQNHRDRPEVQAALALGVGRAQRRSDTLRQAMAYVAVRWGPADAPLGVVRAALPMTRVLQEERRGVVRLLLVALAGVALAGLLGLVASRRITRPLERVAAAAGDMGKGDLSRRAELEGSLEVREVAQSLNHLAAFVQNEIAEVETQRLRLEHLLTRMPDGILALDGDGKVTLVNEAAQRLLGIETRGGRRTPVELVHSAELQAAVDATLRDGRSRTVEIVLHRPDRKLLAVSLVPLERGLIVVVHDITRLRRLEEARREMVSNIGHELRAPLAAVLGYLETLEHDPTLTPEDRARFLGVIARNARRLERLVRDLSHLARLESSPEAITVVQVELAPVVAGAIETLTPRAAGKQVGLASVLPDDLPAVKADPHGLETILLNLLDNALRVSPPRSEVAVGAAPQDGSVRIWVSDHGPGIPRELRQRVFERFFRLDPGRSTEEGGSGLGLAIVKHTVLRLGGEIHVENPPGGGASFVFTLPRW
jgi:two-component system phosphate regulon sensor histidine kinase PhoR